MKKRILDRVSEAAGKGAGWVKSGEAKKALGRLGQKTAEVAREAKDALEGAARTTGEALQEGVQNLRGHVAVETPVDPKKIEQPPPPAPGDELLSEDDRAALRKRDRKVTTATTSVRCPHCDKPVSVAADAELAKCQACNQRFWIELAERS